MDFAGESDCVSDLPKEASATGGRVHDGDLLEEPSPAESRDELWPNELFRLKDDARCSTPVDVRS